MEWFKAALRRAGLTHNDVAEAIGRDRAVVSRIMNGKQEMKPAQAEAIATLLDIPLPEVLNAAGLFSEAAVPKKAPGFAEPDVVPFASSESVRGPQEAIIAAMKADRPGIDVWRVASGAMSLAGFIKDDFMLVDCRDVTRFSDGDVVIAQAYDWHHGTAVTLLRRFKPPYLISHSIEARDQTVHVVDDREVAIKGKVLASWRI
ncbi:helix-turn-helix domain-containing protein [Oceaniglobus trochenteri]|uniref:helix-turn-helix domain-containing protein n=1 Tax=Oceaniglobus trochenteri TaxID=2763260 RepID=UPI001CFF8F22|nr:helix-turn-helix transcriptional regulator [Oceaniglobus trochenteri]